MRIFLIVILFIFSVNLKADEATTNRKIDSLTSLISIQSGRERVETLIELSALYRETSAEKSRETDSQAGEYANQQGLENMRGVILLSMGKTASLTGDYDLALDYFNQAEKALKEANNFVELAKTYTNKGLVYKNMSEFEKSIESYNTAQAIAEEYGLVEQLAGAAASRASTYFSMGDFEKSMENYLQAKETYKELQDSLSYAKMMLSISNIYWKWDQNELALEMLLEAKKVFEEKNDLEELGRALNNLGRMYFQDFNDNALALDYYQQSLTIREKHGNQLGMAIVLANIGNVYRGNNEMDKAFEFFEKSLKISKFIGYKEGAALAYYYMGVAHQVNGDYKASNQMLDSCRKTAWAAEMTQYDSPVNQSKMINSAALGDLAEFLEEFEIYANVHKSVKKELDELKFTELSIRQQLEKLSPELEKAEARLEAQKRSLIFYKITLASLLILLLIAVLYSRKRHKKKLE
ncbi:MAG: tetratricopeptide repeat protein [Bacteroidales bacterium]|nr:tetratricopeptide repeat protein [Bacteroidales bacterium]